MSGTKEAPSKAAQRAEEAAQLRIAQERLRDIDLFGGPHDRTLDVGDGPTWACPQSRTWTKWNPPEAVSLTTTMLIRNTPQHLSANAPAIVHELREAFDARMMELTGAVAHLPSEPPAGAESTAHVFFQHGGLHITAVYNRLSEEFTQLIARDIAEEGTDRPSFTISLFL